MTQKNAITQLNTEEITKIELYNFIAEGLKNIEEGRVYDFDEAFDELEKRYTNVEL